MQGTTETIKVAFVAVMGALLAHVGWLVVPFVMLVVCNILDYATGITAAPYREEVRNSYDGLRGIIKKVMSWLLVVVGVMADILIVYLGEAMGMEFSVGFAVGSVVCVWLLVNEMVSIIENLADMGIQVPFLLPLIKWVRRKTEEVADVVPKDGE